ncbi:MAG: protein translocase SEC61 complex subunit gamma [Candidatus Nanohaloarchaea archaeon]
MEMEELSPKRLRNELQSKLNEYKRVLMIAEQPDWEEFNMSAKITGAGIVIIGLIGFAFYLMQNLIPRYLLG